MKMLTSVEIEQLLQKGLKELRMPGIGACWQEKAAMARRECISFERFLLELVEEERQERHSKRTLRWLRESKLPLEKTLDTFDRARLPLGVDHNLRVLLEGGFLDRRENVLLFGPPGTGKTHLVCALGRELIQQGRRVIFYSCSALVQELLRAKQEVRLPKLVKRLLRYDALIIDDIGYVQQSRKEMEVLFHLLAARYERGSVLVTSNLAFSQWKRIFKDPMMTAAAIDRLVHHCVILELNVPSYRLEASKRRQEADNEAAGRAS